MAGTPRKKSREIVRKLVHILYGLSIALLFSVAGKAESAFILLFVLFSGFLLSELALKRVRLPALCDVLEICDRDHHLRIRPGLGPLRFTLGALITRGVFPARTAIASVLLLTFVDAASALVGMHHGKLRIPWSKKKTIEGTVAGFVAGMVAVLPLLHWKLAAIAAATAALVESLDIDDNVPVPLAAGLAIGVGEWVGFR